MKKIFLVFIGTILIFTSCSKDNNKDLTNNQKKEKSVTQKSKLIGTWKVARISSENTKLTGDLNKFPITIGLSIKGKDYNMAVNFDKDKISNKGDFIAQVVASIPLMGDKSFEQKISQLPSIKGKWEAKDNKLTTEHLGKDEFIKIVSLTEKKVVFSYPIDKLDIDKNVFSQYGIENGQVSGNLMVELTK